MSSLKGVVNCQVFTIIFAIFQHDLASVNQISSKRNHSRQSYDVISISKILKIAAIKLEIHPSFGFYRAAWNADAV